VGTTVRRAEKTIRTKEEKLNQDDDNADDDNHENTSNDSHEYFKTTWRL